MLVLATAFASLAFSGCGEKRFFITLMDGNDVIDSLMTNADGYVDPGEREKLGYVFDGWYLDASLSRKYEGERMWGDASLYCGWTSLEYTVTFLLEGGVFPDVATDDAGTSVDTPVRPTDPAIAVAQTPILGGDGSYTLTVSSGDLLKVVDPEREHYDFSAWSCNGEIVDDSEPFEYAADVTFVAVWNAHYSRITYNADGGSVKNTEGTVLGGSATQYAYYDSPFTPYVAEKEGHTFTGWFDASGERLEATDSWQTEANYSVTAQYTANNYTVTLMLSGGSVNMSVTFGDSYDFTRYESVPGGYVFDRWEYTSGGETYSLRSQGTWSVPYNVALTPKYSARDFNLTLVADSTPYDVVTVSFGSEVILPADPTKDGHTFAGWFSRENGTGERLLPDGYWSWNEDKTFYARFVASGEAVTFSVEYYLEKPDYADDADKYELSDKGFSDVGVIGETVTVNTAGFENKFAYYDFDATDELNAASSIRLTESGGTLRFYFSRETVNYAFMDDTEIVRTRQYRIGQTVLLSDIARKRGYELANWTDAQNNVIPADSTDYKAAETDTVLYADWRIKRYSIYVDDKFALEISYNSTVGSDARGFLLLPDTEDDIFDGLSTENTRLSREDIMAMSTWQIDSDTKASDGTYEIRFESVWQARRAYYTVEILLENEEHEFVHSGGVSFFKNDEINKEITYEVTITNLTVDGVNYVFDADNAQNVLTVTVAADNSAVVKLCYRRV